MEKTVTMSVDATSAKKDPTAAQELPAFPGEEFLAHAAKQWDEAARARLTRMKVEAADTAAVGARKSDVCQRECGAALRAVRATDRHRSCQLGRVMGDGW